MPNTKYPIIRTDDKPQSRETLARLYDTGNPFGRTMLVRDAEGLSAREKAYLNVLATTCGGTAKDIGKDPALTFIGDNEVAAGSATSISVVKAARKDLMTADRLIVTGHWERNDYSWYTRVDWVKLRERSYKWQAMLRQEAEVDARPAAAVRPATVITAEEHAVLDDLDFGPASEKPFAKTPKPSTAVPDNNNLYDLKESAPKSPSAAARQDSRTPFTFEEDESVAPEDDCTSPSLKTTEDEPERTLSYRGHVLLQALIEIALVDGAAFSGDFDQLTEDDEETVVEACENWGIDVGMTSRGYRLTLPLHECIAKRLTHASGKFVAPSACKYIAAKKSDDHYSVVEYGLATESWATLIRKVNEPIRMLMSQFDAIQESWIEQGRPDCEPPAGEAVIYIAGLQAIQPKARPTWTLEERVELFKAQKNLDINDERVMKPTTLDPDDLDAYYSTLTRGWDLIADTAEPVQDDDWVDRTEAAVAQAFIAGESYDPDEDAPTQTTTWDKEALVPAGV
jgi:hypothetical protein